MNLRFSVLRFGRGLRSLLGIGIMLGGGACAMAQQFNQPAVIPTLQYPYSAAPTWPTSFVTGDLDGDGKLDLLYRYKATGAYAGSQYLIPLFNNGGGKFAQPIVGAAFRFIGDNVDLQQTIGPLTKGGQQVLITVQMAPQTSPQVLVVWYKAAKVLSDEVSPFAASGSESATVVAMAVADVNGDGKNDVICEDSDGYLYVLLGDGLGNFKLQTSVALHTPSAQMLVDDFDLDGTPDVATLGTDGEVYVELSDGTGGFKGTRTYLNPGGPAYSMLYADINGDGLKDLVMDGTSGVLSAITATPGYGPNEGSGSIQLGTPVLGGAPVEGHLVAIADLNGDGKADIVTSTPAGITVLLGQGSYNYLPSVPYNAGPGRTSYALADFNGDGKLDLAVDSPEGIAILYGNGDGTFEAGHTFDTGQPAFSMALADFRGTGVLDAVIAIGTPGVQFMQGDGTGNFVIPSFVGVDNPGGTSWSQVVAGDFDGDGKLDVGISLDGPVETDLGPCCNYPASDNGMSVLFGDGTGHFSAPVAEGPANSGAHYGMLAVADLNGDGVSDLVNFDANLVGGYQGGSGARSGSMLLINEFGVWGDGYVRPYQQIAMGYLSPGRTTAPDIVVESLGSSLSFSVQKNDGKGTFSDGQQTFALPSGIAVLNGTSTLPLTGLYPSALLLADLDGDGYGDFLVLYHNLAADPAQPNDTTANLLYIFWGNGDGTFAATPEILTLARNYYQMAVADVDGDAKPDLVLSDGYLVSVMSNDESRDGFAKETHYLAGMGINALEIAPVTGQGSSDIVVATGGAVLAAGVVNRGKLAVNGEVNTGGLTVLPGTAGNASQTGSGTVVASPNPVPYGNGFGLTATLAAASGGAVPTGTVTFSVGSMVECSAQPLTNGVASCYPTATQLGLLNAGTYTLTGAYSGDANNSASTLTGTLTIAQIATTTTLVDVQPIIYYGDIIANDGIEEVSPYPGGGTLDFTINGAVGCTITFPPVAPTASLLCPDTTGVGYPVGTYIVQSVYSGDTNYLPSQSADQTVIILPDLSGPSASTFGEAVTFTATVGDATSNTLGTMSFLDGSSVLGTDMVGSAGTSAFTTSTLAVGTHMITACLLDAADGKTYCSAPLTIVVSAAVTPPPPPPPPPGSYTLTVSPTALSVGVGNSVTAQVVVTALNGFDQPVQLGCSSLPNETTCSFGQAVIPVGGGTTTLVVSPAAPHSCGVSAPDFVAPNLGAGMAGLLLSALALFGMRRRRGLLRGLVVGVLLVAGLGALSGLGGCGGKCKDFGTEPTNYTFNVTGTSMGSPAMSETVVVKLNVHL
jgi:hypothetical protein